MKVSRFLHRYWNTLSSPTGVSPAELFMRRPLCTRLDLMKPSVQTRVQCEQKRYHDSHSTFRQFDVGQSVLVRNFREGTKWIFGTVIEQTGPVSYRIQVQDQVWHRHTDQILDRSSPSQTETENVSEAAVLQPDASSINPYS